jgi:enamine deaminase RidA (YjgF/YER057c/UK114 family)
MRIQMARLDTAIGPGGIARTQSLIRPYLRWNHHDAGRRYAAQLGRDRWLQRRYDMTRRLISSGSSFEREIGYSRAVVEGEWVFVSGTTGFDYEAMTISGSVTEQAAQCLRNIDKALAEAGSRPADIVRVRYILPKVEDFEPCWPVLRKYFGDVRPAATMIAAGLADPRMKIEIEVTARKSLPAVVSDQRRAD